MGDFPRPLANWRVCHPFLKAPGHGSYQLWNHLNPLTLQIEQNTRKWQSTSCDFQPSGMRKAAYNVAPTCPYLLAFIPLDKPLALDMYLLACFKCIKYGRSNGILLLKLGCIKTEPSVLGTFSLSLLCSFSRNSAQMCWLTGIVPSINWNSDMVE